MKNKKLLTRLFALLASLVLVLALALPCFAEEAEQPPTDYIYKRVYSTNELFFYFSGQFGGLACVVREYVDRDFYAFGDLTYNIINGKAIIAWVYNEFEGVADCSLTVSLDGSIVEYSYTYYPIVGDSYSDSFEITWSDFELYILAPAPTGSIIEEQGWYGQIKNIIKDAVFGSDTVLNDSQEFTLNQIALWLSLIVILLPFVIVAVIVVRCFR